MAETIRGVIDVRSTRSVAQTIDRLQSLAAQGGLTVFARIDFSGDAQRAGLSMRPMQMLLFGNPKAGTPLMDQYPSLAIDLPLKALIWESSDKKVYLSYTSPEYLQQRHHLPMVPFAQLPDLFAAALK